MDGAIDQYWVSMSVLMLLAAESFSKVEFEAVAASSSIKVTRGGWIEVLPFAVDSEDGNRNASASRVWPPKPTATAPTKIVVEIEL
jgi:hypothetical protein